VAALHNRIYQTSDLAGAERKTFIDAARRGRAYLRAPDGESLVMLRESVLETTSTIAEIALEYLNVLRVLNKPREERAPSDYGRWAFLEAFDDDDVNEFLLEMHPAIVRSASLARLDEVERTLSDWQRSARTLADPISRSILLGEVDDGEWLEAPYPNVG
jgi:hypothetical protein